MLQKIDEMLGAPPEVKLDLAPKAASEPEAAPAPTLHGLADRLVRRIAPLPGASADGNIWIKINQNRRE